MRTQNLRRRASADRNSHRAAFTLIEMLVVVGLIALLASILLMAARGQITSARNAATQTLLLKINGELDNRLKGLRTFWDNKGTEQDRYAQQNTVSWETLPISDKDALTYVKLTNNLREPAKVPAWKDLVRINFPQRFSEIKDASGNELFDKKADNGTESAEVLYYLITGEEIPDSGTPAVRLQIPGYTALVNADAFTTFDSADTDEDKRREFVDGWGKPLRFYRWPTRLIQQIVVNNQPECRALIRGLPGVDDLRRDPDDPLGTVASLGNETLTKLNPENKWHTLSLWHSMLVVSVGQDETLGLFEPYENLSFGHLGELRDPMSLDSLTDNMTNLNLTAGGR